MQQQLKIDILSYWHAGSGRTSGSHVDSLVGKNTQGLPYLNGRHLKGLLRDAVMRAEAWGWFDSLSVNKPDHLSLTDWLFGTRAATGGDDMTRFETTAGIISISNGELLEAEVTALTHDETLKVALYSHLFSTAIEHDTGTAKKHSLRGIEVVIPLTLYAEIDCQHSTSEIIFEQLNKACSLIDHVGGMRNRGLGRAKLTIEKQGVAA